MSILVQFLSSIVATKIRNVWRKKEACPVCLRPSLPYGEVDFNKSCLELQGASLPTAGIPVVFYRCAYCGFCFAPAIAKWSHAEFAEQIYNENYPLVDPDCIEARPLANAENLSRLLGEKALTLRHLDYGGGNGLLSETLRKKGWDSQSYDPFVNGVSSTHERGLFDLITAYEVFEHAPDPRGLMADLTRLLKPDGIVLFSTLVSDGVLGANGSLSWWYASPRNGHISLFSRQSLSVLAAANGFSFSSFSDGFHCMWRTPPAWAVEFIPAEGRQASLGR